MGKFATSLDHVELSPSTATTTAGKSFTSDDISTRCRLFSSINALRYGEDRLQQLLAETSWKQQAFMSSLFALQAALQKEIDVMVQLQQDETWRKSVEKAEESLQSKDERALQPFMLPAVLKSPDMQGLQQSSSRSDMAENRSSSASQGNMPSAFAFDLKETITSALEPLVVVAAQHIQEAYRDVAQAALMDMEELRQRCASDGHRSTVMSRSASGAVLPYAGSEPERVWDEWGCCGRDRSSGAGTTSAQQSLRLMSNSLLSDVDAPPSLLGAMGALKPRREGSHGDVQREPDGIRALLPVTECDSDD